MSAAEEKIGSRGAIEKTKSRKEDAGRDAGEKRLITLAVAKRLVGATPIGREGRGAGDDATEEEEEVIKETVGGDELVVKADDRAASAV